jgi:hypothetical protein
MGMLKPDTNLPEWVQSKITLAKDYIQTAADYFATEMSEEAEQIDELSKDKLQRYRKASTPERLDPKKGDKRRAGMDLALKKILGSDRYGNKPKIKATREEVEIEEAKSCNMTEAGTMCEVHGMKPCGEKEEKNSAADKEPRYNGKKKEGRQLITDKKKLDEREMTAADKKKEEKLKSKYDDSGMKASMQKQYGAEKGKQVYFAYIRKKAMKSEQADTHIATPSGNVGDTGRV